MRHFDKSRIGKISYDDFCDAFVDKCVRVCACGLRAGWYLTYTTLCAGRALVALTLSRARRSASAHAARDITGA